MDSVNESDDEYRKKKVPKNVFVVRKRNLCLNLVRSSENVIFASVYIKYAKKMCTIPSIYLAHFP